MTNPAALSAFASGEIENFLVASTPGGIEASERAGQVSMAAQFKTLPKQMDREVAEALGFVFGEDADELFVNVTAPEGWSIRPTDHAMHSDILDASGAVRGSIFYKAAFYDRRAHGRWARRFKAETDYDAAPRVSRVWDTKTGAVLWTSEPGDSYAEQDVHDEQALAWMAERYPDHSNPLAYRLEP